MISLQDRVDNESRSDFAIAQAADVAILEGDSVRLVLRCSPEQYSDELFPLRYGHQNDCGESAVAHLENVCETPREIVASYFISLTGAP